MSNWTKIFCQLISPTIDYKLHDIVLRCKENSIEISGMSIFLDTSENFARLCELYKWEHCKCISISDSTEQKYNNNYENVKIDD